MNPMTKWIVISIIFLGLLGDLYIQNKEVDRLNIELEDSQSNYNAYVNLYDGELSANSILKLSEYELKSAKDSLLRELGRYVDENRKLKNIKKPEIVAGVTQVIRDTIFIEVPVKLPQFNVIKELNPETIIEVNGMDSTLTLIPNISNTIKLELGTNRIYKNPYKSGWHRFWHFDWKKVNSYEYRIEQSNYLIKLKDVKLIKISE